MILETLRGREGIPMEREFEDGATVQLKSGGPIMTVVDHGQWGYDSHEKYKCTWFDKGELKDGLFPGAALTRADQTVGAVRTTNPLRNLGRLS
jgi:uncharacterized protein YodC (DUF2158 family)